MSGNRKHRLNLYISKDLLDFAKEWSYVTNVPISRMLEEHLRSQQQLVSSITPFQWFSDPEINPDLTHDDESLLVLEEYINNREEAEFCRKNPQHPRAKIRRKMVVEYKTSSKKKIEEQKIKEKEIIQRWLEVFPLK